MSYTQEVFDTREEWLAARQNGITSTDAPVIVGISPYKKPFRLYHEKRGTVPFTTGETEAMFWGKVLEEPIAQRFTRETGAVVTNPGEFAIQRSDEQPGMLISTVDRFIDRDEMTGSWTDEWKDATRECIGDGILEIKNAGFYVAEKWHDEPPLDFQVQVQHQLAVTGLQWGAIAGLLGGNKFVWAIVQRDQAFIDKLIALEIQFRDDVINEREPSTDASEDTKKLIAALWPSETGEQVVLPVEALDVHEALKDAKARKKVAEEDERAGQNALKVMIGSATVGIHESGLVYTLKNTTRRAHEVKESTSRTLRCKNEPK